MWKYLEGIVVKLMLVMSFIGSRNLKLRDLHVKETKK